MAEANTYSPDKLWSLLRKKDIDPRVETIEVENDETLVDEEDLPLNQRCAATAK